jgi:hypothetical protein
MTASKTLRSGPTMGGEGRTPAASSSRRSFRSAPTQKALPPEPRTTTTHTSGSSVASADASTSARDNPRDRALRRSGRSSVSQAAFPTFS